jgi:ElaB/YqjD/DUF883 family membrane-anchored ribosome-binding protein
MAEPNDSTPAPSVTVAANPSGATSAASPDTPASPPPSGANYPQSGPSAASAASRPPGSPDGSDFREASKAWDSSAGSSSRAATSKSVTSDRLAQVKGRLSNAQEVVKDKCRVVTDSTDDFVRENPWKAIALAAVAGMVVGRLVAR